jgi:hypothetical protein
MMKGLCNLLDGSPLGMDQVGFDTGKILNSLFVLFMVLECIEEKNFKTIYEVKEKQIYYYASKTKQGNAYKAEWGAGVRDTWRRDEDLYIRLGN